MIARSKAELKYRRILKFVQDVPGSTRTGLLRRIGRNVKIIDAMLTAGVLIGEVDRSGKRRPPTRLTCSPEVGDLDTLEGLPVSLVESITAALESGVVVG